MLTFTEYVGECVRNNRPIDRELLASNTGECGAVLESRINRAICSFVYKSMGATGRPGEANAPRDGHKKREARNAS